MVLTAAKAKQLTLNKTIIPRTISDKIRDAIAGGRFVIYVGFYELTKEQQTYLLVLGYKLSFYEIVHDRGDVEKGIKIEWE
jgi:hypothetical protein